MNINLFRDITGADRGINVRADVLTQTADGVNLNVLWDEYTDALALANEQRSLISRIFTYDTTDAQSTLPLDPNSQFEFEEASEFGVPEGARSDERGYVVGFPLRWYQKGSRFTRAFLRDAQRKQVDAVHAAMIAADRRLLFKRTLAALTTPTVEGTRPINEAGASIYSLYAGSPDDTPPSFGGRTFAPGHNHYLVSGAATIDGGDLKSLTEHIQHHGHGLPADGERVIIMVHPSQGDVIRTFRRDPEDNPAAPVNPFDFIPSTSAPAYLTAETINGEQPPAEFHDLPIIGSYGDAWIYESYYIPTGYVLALGTAGPGSARNPLAFREHVSAESRGLRLNPENLSFPLIGSVYERGFGVGVRNRGAAAVMQIKASGSYVAPVWS